MKIKDGILYMTTDNDRKKPSSERKKYTKEDFEKIRTFTTAEEAYAYFVKHYDKKVDV